MVLVSLAFPESWVSTGLDALSEVSAGALWPVSAGDLRKSQANRNVKQSVHRSERGFGLASGSCIREL